MENMNNTTVETQKDLFVQLISGLFSPAEAKDLVSALLDEKINYHNMRRLCDSIHDEKNIQEFHSAKMDALKQEKMAFKEIVRNAKANGRQIRISGKLDIELI